METAADDQKLRHDGPGGANSTSGSLRLTGFWRRTRWTGVYDTMTAGGTKREGHFLLRTSATRIAETLRFLLHKGQICLMRRQEKLMTDSLSLMNNVITVLLSNQQTKRSLINDYAVNTHGVGGRKQ